MAAITNLETHESHRSILSAMDEERSHWFSHWRDVSDYFLPRRYPWLLTQREVRTADRRNRKLLDSTSTLAVRTLASGMMNGITSPARPWFRLRVSGFKEESMSVAAKIHLEEVERRMYLAMSESNFYNSMAILYLEWCTFGTASMAIFEDFQDIFRCYNYALGEFYLSQDNTQRIDRHGRRFEMSLKNMAKEFGEENLPQNEREILKRKDGSQLKTREIAHLIEENLDDGLLKGDAKWRECYWMVGQKTGDYLAVRPFYDWPCVTPRWELLGDDCYGTSPAMDALSDVQQLQNMLLERAQALAKMVRPPLIVDSQLANRPKALGAGGITYASAFNSNFGAKEAYSVRAPLQEIAFDIQQLQNHIRETCHNNLFNMISQLETVRSATEIDARREEKLVHLGPVLERFYNEGLDPALKRIYGIMDRAGLFPEPPEELSEAPIEVQYVSILSDAQRAVGTMNIERFFQFTGNLAGVYPEITQIPNVDELVRDYAEGIGLKPSALKSAEQVAEAADAANAQQQLAQSAAIGNDLASGAKVLSEADVGGGQNALQALMG
tara:strand:- start:25445 stop:27109 length:1665 start_codon:yes stop_codon:yes gene_type:complete